MFCLLFRYFSSVKAVLVYSESVTIEDAETRKKDRKDAMANQMKKF